MYGIIRDTRTLLNQNIAFPIFWEIPKFAEYILTKKIYLRILPLPVKADRNTVFFFRLRIYWIGRLLYITT